MSRSRPWIVDQPMLLPPSVGDFVKPKHLALFVRELVQRDLDLSSIEMVYSNDPPGNPPSRPDAAVR
jgi:hypothetical protein